MAAIESSWLVGSQAIPLSALSVGGVAHNVAAGDYYLRDATVGLSLIQQVEDAIAAQVAGSTVRVLQNRKVHIDFNSSSTALSIPTTLAAALGFTGSPYAGATTRTAELISPLLWSPGWPETTIGHPVGTRGYEVPNWQQTASPSGLTTRTVQHGTAAVLTELSWDKVLQARVWTTDDGLGGEFRRFMRDVLTPGYRWKLYSGITEDEASSTAVTWTTADGPYVLRDPEWQWFTRSIASVDRFSSISIKGHLVTEIS